MKKLIAVLVIVLGTTFSLQAQEMKTAEKETAMKSSATSERKTMKTAVKTITLEQVKGEFVEKTRTIKAGSYVFDIANNNVGHDVGFVLVKKGNDISNPENHIKTAYVTKPVANNTTGSTNVTQLEKGEYIYFCPLNPTATDNVLIVQ